MLILLSPSKKMDFNPIKNTEKYTQPLLIQHSFELINTLKQLSVEDLIKLMNISYGLAENNIERFNNWNIPFTISNSKQAVLAFNGDVYEELKATEMTENELLWAQNHLRIISGLYGILRPLDLIQPYRLPMGTKIQINKTKDLYDFWDRLINDHINQHIEEQKIKNVINLASKEYADVINFNKLKAKCLNITFKENKNGKYRVVGINSKKARGAMARFIIKNRLTDIEQLKDFKEKNYVFYNEESSENELVFIK